MKTTRVVLALSGAALLVASSAAFAAQDPVVLPTAVHTIDLLVGSSFGDAPMAVAYDPHFGGRYYATEGGSPSDHAYVFSATGTLLQNIQPSNLDCRGIGYNWNTGQIEVNSFNAVAGGASYGLYTMGRAANGNFTGTNTRILTSVPGLADAQSMPCYDAARDRFYSRSGNFNVRVAKRSDGSLITTVVLDTTGLGLQSVSPAGPVSLVVEPIGFDSTYSVFITVDYNRKRVLVHRLDGSYVGGSTLPAVPAITLDSYYGMGYANGQVFLATGSGASTAWFGYRVLDPPAASSVTYDVPDQQYRLIGQPVEPASNIISRTFGAALGGADTTQWRLGHWLPNLNAYQLAHSSYAAWGLELTATDPGYGYWLITRGAKGVGVSGSKTPNTWATSLVNGPAGAAAFNQLGNPFDVAIPLSSIRVRQGTATQYLTAATNTLTDHVVWTWNGSAYQSVAAGASISPNQGFWLLRNTGGTADIVYARPGVNPEPALVAGGSEEATSDAPSWSVTLTASQNGRAATPLMLGAAATDAMTLDAMSHRLPPAPPGGAMRLVSQRSLEGVATPDLAMDFRAPAAVTTFDLALSGAEAPGELSLAVEAANLPAGARLELVDQTSGIRYPLTPGNATTLAAFSGERHFQLRADLASGDVSGPAQVASGLRLAYPNPFRSSVGMTFSIARAGDVRAELFDLQGRRVRTIERRGLTAGEHVLVWDGRDDAGRSLGRGVYLARWRSPESEGTIRIVKLD